MLHYSPTLEVRSALCADGEVDCSAKDIKGAIDDMMAGDVF